MHSATYGQTRFHFSSGLDGPIIINVPSSAIEADYFPDDKTMKTVELPEGTYQVEVPGEDIISLVLDSFRSNMISELEDADDETLTKLARAAISALSSRTLE